ncbi:MAG: hypothetical protein IKE30_01650 [Clostridia bacterium]|nr:hypothetical protein [Clostridia bacterium]
MKRWTALLMLLPLLILFCAQAASAENGLPALTLMVYMTGSDLETKGGAASADLEEMRENLPAGGSVQIVVMASGAREWRNADAAADATSLYRLTKDGLIPEETGPLVSMGSGDTLLRLLRFGHERYPAEQYALLLWDHGAGPMGGICFDELFESEGNRDFLTMEELEGALRQSPFAEEKLSWIGMDACMMASFETACTVAPYAEWLIASQEQEPASGWNYAFLRDIAGDAGGAETGRRAIEAYLSENEDSLSDIALSCVDLQKIDPVKEAMTGFFGGLKVTPDTYPRYTEARVDTRSAACSSPFEYDLVDLLDLVETLSEAEEGESAESARVLMEALKGAVAYNGTNADCLNGMSVYYPFYNRERYASPWSSRLAGTETAPGYRAYLKDMSGIWLGDALSEWKTLRILESEDAAGPVRITVPLTERQAGCFASARLLVFSEIAPDQYKFLYSTSDVQRSETDELSCVYNNEALFIVGEDGSLLSGAVTYRALKEGIMLPVILYKRGALKKISEGGEVSVDEVLQGAYMVFRQDGEGVWQLAELHEISASEESAGKPTLRLEDWDEIWITSGTRVLTRDPEGGLLNPNDWPVSSYKESNVIKRSDGVWHPQFLSLEDGEKRIALMAVTDVQGIESVSEPYEVLSAKRHSILEQELPLLNDRGVEITLASLEAAEGTDPQISGVMRVKNGSAAALTFELRDLFFNNTRLANYRNVSDLHLDPGGEGRMQFSIKQDLLKESRVRQLERIALTAVGTDEEGEILLCEAVEFPAPLDLLLLIDSLTEDSPIARAEQGGIAVELLGFERHDSDAVWGQLHIANGNEETVSIACGPVIWLNSQPFSGGLGVIEFYFDFPEMQEMLLRILPVTQECVLTLPPGCDSYVPLVLGWKDLIDGRPPEQTPVSRLMFELRTGDEIAQTIDSWLETAERQLSVKTEEDIRSFSEYLKSLGKDVPPMPEAPIAFTFDPPLDLWE